MATTQLAEQPTRTDEHAVVDGLPPGPRWPRTVQTAWWAARRESLLNLCRRQYGDVFTVRPYAFGDIVVIADPRVIKDVFTGDPELFAAGAANYIIVKSVLGDGGLFTLDGQRHLRQRKMMLPPFHGKAIARYQERVADITEAEVATWPTDKPFAIWPRMHAITLETILRAVIGVSDPRRLERLRELLPKVLDFGLVHMWSAWMFPKLVDTSVAQRAPSMRVRPEIDRLLYEEIAAHRADPDGRDDILALLVSARDVDDEPLSDRNLRDQLMTLLLAGHETTTSELAFAFERLTRHPAALRRLTQSLDNGDDEYLDAVVNETLRARPVVDGVWRKLTAPAVVAGHRLPAGTTLYPGITLVQTSAEFRDAREFRPERFLDGTPAPYTFIPFGGGTRRCVGAAFAVMEMKTVISTVLRRVELSAAGRRGEKSRVNHVTQAPSRGARVIASRRR